MLNVDNDRSFSPVSFGTFEAQAKIKFVSKPGERKTLEAQLHFISSSVRENTDKMKRVGKQGQEMRKRNG